MDKYSTGQFQESCGARRPLELRVRSLGAPREDCLKVLPQPFALIGRDQRADVVLDDAQVSRKHAYLQVIAGRVFCVDLGSRTGIRRDGGPLTSGWLAPGHVVEIGPYRIELIRPVDDDQGGSTGPAGWPDPREESAARPDQPGMVLEVLNRAGGPSSRTIRRQLALLGRERGCLPRLSDASVSRFHCSLVHTPAGIWMVDLLSRGGVRVGGVIPRFARIEAGNELQVGGFRVRVHDGSRPGAKRQPQLGRPTAAMPPASRSGADSSSPSVLATFQDLVRPGAGLPGITAEVEDPHLAPLVQQFGKMQQSMFDQFQQAMVMMLQMFGSLHRDQMGELRAELEQLRRLSEELRVLQAESSHHRTGATGVAMPARSTGPVEGETGPRPVESIAAVDPLKIHNPGALESAEEEAWAPGTGPKPFLPFPAREGPRDPRTTDHDGAQATTRAVGPRPSSASQPDVADPVASSDAVIHAALSRKIAELQDERQTRWQRIMSLVMGG